MADGRRPFLARRHTCSSTSVEDDLSHCGGERLYGRAERATPFPLLCKRPIWWWRVAVSAGERRWCLDRSAIRPARGRGEGAAARRSRQRRRRQRSPIHHERTHGHRHSTAHDGGGAVYCTAGLSHTTARPRAAGRMEGGAARQLSHRARTLDKDHAAPGLRGHRYEAATLESEVRTVGDLQVRAREGRRVRERAMRRRRIRWCGWSKGRVYGGAGTAGGRGGAARHQAQSHTLAWSTSENRPHEDKRVFEDRWIAERLGHRRTKGQTIVRTSVENLA